MKQPDETLYFSLDSLAKSALQWLIYSTIFLFSIHFLLYREWNFSFRWYDPFLFIGGYLLLIILHEVFHLIGFRIFGNVPWKDMTYGVDFKRGIAYASHPHVLSNRAMKAALLLPFWMTAFIPAVLGLIYDNGHLLLLAAFLTSGAAGDFAMYQQLRRFPNDFGVKDHPTEPRLFIFYK